jgi:hypothetical protein
MKICPYQETAMEQKLNLALQTQLYILKQVFGNMKGVLKIKNGNRARCEWLTPVILVIQEDRGLQPAKANSL